MVAFSLITDRISNSIIKSRMAKTSSASIRSFQQASNVVAATSMPIAILVVLAFIAASSIAVIYPAFEKINRVRALHYCNGVSPFALWFGYLMFDLQFIVIQTVVVWSLFLCSFARKAVVRSKLSSWGLHPLRACHLSGNVCSFPRHQKGCLCNCCWPTYPFGCLLFCCIRYESIPWQPVQYLPKLFVYSVWSRSHVTSGKLSSRSVPNRECVRNPLWQICNRRCIEPFHV